MTGGLHNGGIKMIS